MDTTYIDIGKIPQPAIDRLSEGTIKLLKTILATHGGREALDAKTAARFARKAAAGVKPESCYNSK